MSEAPRILLLDIETLPNVVTSWGLKVDGWLDHANIVQERTIICAAWKWLGSPTVHSEPAGKGKVPDLPILRKLHGAMSDADGIVAHNGDRFDLPWIRTRMLLTDLEPPPPVPTIDTFKIAKARFHFNSNRLDYLGKYLGVGRKLKTDFGLWLDAMKGDRKAIERMSEYNREDVRLLERVFLKLRPHVPAKVNAALWGKADPKELPECPTCGESALHARGIQRSRVNQSQRFQCKACGAWSSRPTNSKVAR